jgi:hypothetical protein
MKARNIVLVAVLFVAVLCSACGGDTTADVSNAADQVRADGRVDAAADVAGDGDKLVALSNTLLSGDSCQSQLKALWQYTGEGKVKFLVSIRPGCVDTDAMDDWNEKFEDATGQTWEEYQAAQ